MSSHTPRTPSYRLHKPSGLAVVTLDGRDRYLGPHGSPGSRAEYDRLIAEWLSNGRTFLISARGTDSDLTLSERVAELVRAAVPGLYAGDIRPGVAADASRFTTAPRASLIPGRPDRAAPDGAAF